MLGVITAPNQPSFFAFPSASDTISGTNAGISLPYDTIGHDSAGGYNTTTFEYTIQVAGDYFIYFSCGITAGFVYATSLRINNNLADRCLIRDKTLLTVDYDTPAGKGMSMLKCAVGDVLKVTCNGDTRSCTLESPSFGAVNSFGGFLIG